MIQRRHLYILQTPLFRVRTKKKRGIVILTRSVKEPLQNLAKNQEITRFKGLGEISPEEFGAFISPEAIRLDPIVIGKDSKIDEMLTFYMGKNTKDRQDFIIENLKVEEDLSEMLKKEKKDEAPKMILLGDIDKTYNMRLVKVLFKRTTLNKNNE